MRGLTKSQVRELERLKLHVLLNTTAMSDISEDDICKTVASNKRIRSMLINLCKQENYESIFPPIQLCSDNAAMIAMVGLEKFKLKQFDKLDYPAKPRWPLDENAVFLKGAGVQL